MPAKEVPCLIRNCPRESRIVMGMGSGCTGQPATGRPCPTVTRSPRWAPRVTPMTTRWPRPSTRCTRPNSSATITISTSMSPGRASTTPVFATTEWAQLVGQHPASLRHRHAHSDRARAGQHPTTTRRHQHHHRARLRGHGCRRADHYQPTPAGDRRRQIKHPPQNPGA